MKGQQHAGFDIGTTFLVLMAPGVIISVSITSVGVISFIGLIAPNIARHLALKAKSELIASCVLGALLLCVTDSLAIFLAQWSFGYDSNRNGNRGGWCSSFDHDCS
ncbi:iron chelate uptake ABC transporter family permease subunit [Vibrio chagasii]|nr:iron chelate uptake ABC transporter family permease subunit [Vibrio chagasii]